MKYINRFQNEQALSVSVVNSYSEYQLMHIFLNNFHQGGEYSAQIESQQVELRIEENFMTKTPYLFHLYRLII